MKCFECQTEMESRVGSYAYKECGLPNVTLQNITLRKCPSCGEEEAVIPRVLALHQAIAEQVSKKPERLTPPEIRFLRTHLGWSGADFARIFSVTPATVSRWETGTSTMGLVQEKLLRLCIALVQQGELQPVEDYWLEHLPEFGSLKKKAARLFMMVEQEHWQASAV